MVLLVQKVLLGGEREEEDLKTPHQPILLLLTVRSLKPGRERAKSFLRNAISTDEAVRGVIRSAPLQRRLVRKEWAFGLLQDQGTMKEMSSASSAAQHVITCACFCGCACAGVARNFMPETNSMTADLLCTYNWHHLSDNLSVWRIIIFQTFHIKVDIRKLSVKQSLYEK